MARPKRLTIAKADILSRFDREPQKVYSQGQLAQVLTQHRNDWRLAQRTSAYEFIDFLERQGKLKKNELNSPNYNRKTVRYSWGDASIYELAQSLNPRAYLSHATAVTLHSLTDLIPKTVYVNIEQGSKPEPTGGLTQRGIAQAFARKQRQSQMVYRHKDWSVTVINGKNTGALGVEQILGSSEEKLRVTNLERTLIDIVVRPAYAGGIFQVLEAYRAAKESVSTNRLVATLKKLNYVYPYHQAIGFLMERAGYGEKRYSLLKQIGLSHDFYLTHGMQNPNYSKEWRLFFPDGV